MGYCEYCHEAATYFCSNKRCDGARTSVCKRCGCSIDFHCRDCGYAMVEEDELFIEEV